MNVILPGALPVSWLNFNVVNTQNADTWSWQLATEENVASYTPEYSQDGQHYTSAGQITNLNENHTYSFTATLAISGRSSFRLKVADLDGSIKYSKTRILNTNAANIISAYPNPVTDFLYIQNTDPKATSANQSVTDSRGSTVSKQQCTVTNDQFKVQFSGLASGVYYISLKNNLGHLYTSGPIIKK